MHVTTPTFAVIGAVLIPFLLSIGSILMRKMKGVPEIAVSLYKNPLSLVFNLMIMWGEGLDLKIFRECTWIDWLVIIVWAGLSIAYQTLKFRALQYEFPGKLSHYQYLASVYQLIFDIAIVDSTFSVVQWIGLGIMFGGYLIKTMYSIMEYKRSAINKR